MRVLENGRVKIWADGVPLEDNTIQQALNLSAVPGVERVAIMPDAHLGNGACVGSAILTRDVVPPAAVGVDIGCGMVAARTGLRRSDLGDLHELRLRIEALVPVGRTDQGGAGDRGSWGGTPPQDVLAAWSLLEPGYEEILEGHPMLVGSRRVNQLGTLGTGNHFVEVCVETGAADSEGWLGDTEPDPPIWVMLHSGSRGIGNRIGQYFTKLARGEMKRWHVELPDPELAFLADGTEVFGDYLAAADWAQRYAWASRLIMLERTLQALRRVAGEPALETVHCHHNYIARERHFGKPGLLIRKGAVDAHVGVMGIIPGSMGTRSYITSGLGLPEALMTSSHGAGRVMSRTAARKAFSLDDHALAVASVECRMDADVVDETPAAYKDIDAVMAAQADLTEVRFVLKQIVCVKG